MNKRISKRQRVSLTQNLQNLKEIKKIAQLNNFKVVFLSQMAFNNNYLERGFGSIVEPYVEIYNELKDREDIEKYFIDVCHGSVKGHKEIATVIYNYFLKYLEPGILMK